VSIVLATLREELSLMHVFVNSQLLIREKRQVVLFV